MRDLTKAEPDACPRCKGFGVMVVGKKYAPARLTRCQCAAGQVIATTDLRVVP